MDFLRFDWDKTAGFFSRFLDTEYDELVEMLGPFELNRQFRAAVQKNKKTILTAYPQEITDVLFHEDHTLREFCFTEQLYDALCTFMERYTGSLLAKLKRKGIRPFTEENTENRDLRKFLSLSLYDLTVIEVAESKDTVTVKVDTYGGFTSLIFKQVTLFDYDGCLTFNTYVSDELFRLPDALEFNLSFPDGGLRIHFKDFSLKREYTDNIDAFLT